MVPLVLVLSVTCVLAGKHLRPLTIIVLIAQSATELTISFLSCLITQEPVLITIEMLVNEVCLQFLHGLPALLKHLTLRVRTTGTYNLDVRIFSLDGCHERLQALEVEVIPLLITHTDELHVERLGMSHLRADLSPLRVSRTIGKLDEVETVLDIWLQLIVRNMGRVVIPVLELTSHTYVQHRQRLGTDIL